jgi:hypothetical protein
MPALEGNGSAAAGSGKDRAFKIAGPKTPLKVEIPDHGLSNGLLSGPPLFSPHTCLHPLRGSTNNPFMTGRPSMSMLGVYLPSLEIKSDVIGEAYISCSA